MTYLNSTPITIATYSQMEKSFKDQVFWKILHKSDQLVKQTMKEREDVVKRVKGVGGGAMDDEVRKAVMASLVLDEEEQNTLNQIVKNKAQILVIKNEFEVLLVKESIKFIALEDQALVGALEMGCAEG